jgi:acyl-CoA synthetase (AMP-forming)/AMP-acid ligase II
MKIFPADIDEAVEQFSAVKDVCSFGYTDDFYGENVGLAIVLDNRDERTVFGLYQWVADHLAKHKHPERWFLLDEIPRTSRGKINRESVRQACETITPVNMRELVNFSRKEQP